MKVLVIDSHKGSEGESPKNLHWQNSKVIADHLGADLIWSYPSVNDNIKSGYDAIIFVHSSRYSYIDKAWLTNSPEAKVFFVTNEYNLGEPIMMWKEAKSGRKYQVIANHDAYISKVVTKYTSAWHKVNLNALVAQAEPVTSAERSGCVYYGSFRKDRCASFRRYLTSGQATISTHAKNRFKWEAAGISGPFIDRLKNGDLSHYRASLYIEDEVTHNNYNYLANRFYEAINHDTIPLFGFECRQTMEKSGYAIPSHIVVSDPDAMAEQAEGLRFDLREWRAQAMAERAEALDQISSIIHAN